MPGFVGPLELLAVLVVVVALFGAKRLPELGRAAGAALHGFRKESTGRDDGQLDRVMRDVQPSDPPVPPR